jgi:hypothetical protein
MLARVQRSCFQKSHSPAENFAPGWPLRPFPKLSEMVVTLGNARGEAPALNDADKTKKNRVAERC